MATRKRASKKKNKPNAAGRNPTPRFVQLHHSLLETPAYRSLSCNARALLVELVMIENGSNNGSLYLSERDAAARMGRVDVGVASKAFVELETMGFVAMTKEAHFEVKAADGSRARCWRLTWIPMGKSPTHDYQYCQPSAGTSERKRMERGLKALKRFKRGRLENRFPVLESNSMNLVLNKPEIKPVRKNNTGNGENVATLGVFVELNFNTHTSGTMAATFVALARWKDWRISPSPRCVVIGQMLEQLTPSLCGLLGNWVPKVEHRMTSFHQPSLDYALHVAAQINDWSMSCTSRGHGGDSAPELH